MLGGILFVELIAALNLYFLEGEHDAMRLDVDVTYTSQ